MLAAARPLPSVRASSATRVAPCRRLAVASRSPSSSSSSSSSSRRRPARVAASANEDDVSSESVSGDRPPSPLPPPTSSSSTSSSSSSSYGYGGPNMALDSQAIAPPSPRRVFLGVLATTALALGGNFLGVTGKLLNEDLAASLRLDILYPVNGMKRCYNPEKGYEFIYPETYLGDATMATRAANQREARVALDPGPATRAAPPKIFGQTVQGAFIFTLVPIRPRPLGERRSLRTLSPGDSLLPPLAFDPRPRRLSPPLLTPFNSASDAFQLRPDVASYGTTLKSRRARSGPWAARARRTSR
jgi:hypothetical protein